jgi:hypothetical protein
MKKNQIGRKFKLNYLINKIIQLLTREMEKITDILLGKKGAFMNFQQVT